MTSKSWIYLCALATLAYFFGLLQSTTASTRTVASTAGARTASTEMATHVTVTLIGWDRTVVYSAVWRQEPRVTTMVSVGTSVCYWHIGIRWYWNHLVFFSHTWFYFAHHCCRHVSDCSLFWCHTLGCALISTFFFCSPEGCRCTDEWRGETCEIPVDPNCQGFDCMYGTCTVAMEGWWWRHVITVLPIVSMERHSRDKLNAQHRWLWE